MARTLLASSLFMNGLLMFNNTSVTAFAFTKWFATTMPGNASCKDRLFCIKNYVSCLVSLMGTSYIFFSLFVVAEFCYVIINP